MCKFPLFCGCRVSQQKAINTLRFRFLSSEKETKLYKTFQHSSVPAIRFVSLLQRLIIKFKEAYLIRQIVSHHTSICSPSSVFSFNAPLSSGWAAIATDASYRLSRNNKRSKVRLQLKENFAWIKS